MDTNFPDISDLYWNPPPIVGPRSADEFAFLGKYKNSIRQSFAPSYRISAGNKIFDVGLDKIDHFFAHGYLYWKMISGKRDPLPKEIETVLHAGDKQEEGTWGLRLWGIKSYGDLAANYLGLSFWQNLLDGDNPHIVCVGGRYELVRTFRIGEYLDASVDEGINCSSFSSPEIKSAMTDIEVKLAGKNCPLEPKTCADLNKRYPSSISKHILHPLCRGESHDRIEQANELTTRQFFEDAQQAVSGTTNLLKMFFPSPSKSGTKAETRADKIQ